MWLSKEKIRELTEAYMIGNLADNDDIASMFEIVADIFEFEADLIKEKEPYAVRTIERYREVQREIRSLGSDVDEVMMGA